MQLSQLLPRKKYPILSPYLEKEPRIQLLRRLDDKNLEYCCECWILHPRSSPSDSQNQSCLQCQKLHGRLCFGHGLCMPYAGVVALCPCLTLSFRDKIQILEDVDIFRAKGNRDSAKAFALVCHRDYPLKTLQHECRIQHPTIAALLLTSFSHQNYGEKLHLIISSSYSFKFSDKSGRSLSRSEAMCPHKDIRSWLKQFFTEAGSSFSGWPCGQQSGNPATKLPGVSVTISTNENHTLGVSISRDLGSMNWPDENWVHHRLN